MRAWFVLKEEISYRIIKLASVPWLATNALPLHQPVLTVHWHILGYHLTVHHL